jgi:hypothetical protein
MKCAICGGKFVRMPVMLSDDSGMQRRVSRLGCNQCGDSPFSPEQYTAFKFKHSGNEQGQPKKVPMIDDTFDNFLQDAVLSLHELWTGAGGRELTPEELQDLNDALQVLFESRQ